MENIGAITGFWVRGAKKCSNFAETATASRFVKRWASKATISLSFFAILFVGFFLYWAEVCVTPGSLLLEEFFSSENSEESLQSQMFPINCAAHKLSESCPANYLNLQQPKAQEISGGKCPEFFWWIHKDLEPWKRTGISRELIESAEKHANFRLVIINGEAYVEKYKKNYQTRDLFTIWGILQLLRLYPGKVPDLELMFWCDDTPVIEKKNYQGANSTLMPPPVFHYCGHQESLDIVFPDWTFWGWAETNLKPWNSILEDIKEGNKRIKWRNRVPYAYWKGNPFVSKNRVDLLKCNVTDKYQWKTHLHVQDWNKESEEGYKNSKLADQCTYRYKIYAEGRTWSVSEKYILACDSMTLMIEPKYYDFFSRSMVPLQHYWPVRNSRKCRDIKFAVEWGNNHSRQARAIGRAGSRYIQQKLKMKYVYDYMFHLLSEYAKLLKFEPRIPKRAKKVCSQEMACSQKGLWKSFMVESMVNSASESLPCTMPPAFEPLALEAFLENKERIKRQVVMWEKEFWESFKFD